MLSSVLFLGKEFKQILPYPCMQTLFCPECKAALKVVYSKEGFDGWKRCQKCNRQSYIVVNEIGDSQVRSLAGMIKELSTRKYSVQALLYLLKNGEVWINDMIFEVGQKANYDLEQLQRLQVIERIRNHLKIKSDMEKDVALEIEPYLRTKPDWYTERFF